MSLIALSLYQALQIRQKEKKIELNVRAPALKCDMHIIIAIRLHVYFTNLSSSPSGLTTFTQCPPV